MGFSLLGAEWVLYVLIFLSIFSVTILFERSFFYRAALGGIEEFRRALREAVNAGQWDRALSIAKSRADAQPKEKPDLESAMAVALLSERDKSPEVMNELAQDHVVRARVKWERSLSLLATIGNNAPFVGLFGTVLGIIKAFNDLSQQNGGAAGVSGVTAGVADALVATAVGILVAIPAVVGFNLYQRRTKSALSEAEALKSFLVGKIAGGRI
ncbi:MAG: MotA/TolQ/ExbB proton channel family protein [Bdellovibrionales bacterium]|nr:MotA/TolQ/ExbB proton channel family protein [Bdellovibrionales bacterium]